MGEVAMPPDKRLLKYAKMLKVLMPTSTVKQKMEVDGIPVDVIDDFFTGGLAGVYNNRVDAGTDGAESGVSNRTMLTASKAFKSYSQMLKMDIHEQAVRLRMRAAGVSEEVINLFFVEYWDNTVSGLTVSPPLEEHQLEELLDT